MAVGGGKIISGVKPAGGCGCEGLRRGVWRDAGLCPTVRYTRRARRRARTRLRVTKLGSAINVGRKRFAEDVFRQKELRARKSKRQP